MFGTLLFLGVVISVIILCICCLTPSCPCYHNRHAVSRTTRTVVIAQPATAPQVVTMAATTTKTAAFPEPPPAYNPDTGYVQQPYPPAPRPAGYPNYPTGYPNY